MSAEDADTIEKLATEFRNPSELARVKNEASRRWRFKFKRSDQPTLFEREEEKKQGAATHPWKEVGVRTAEPSMRQTISPRGGIVSLPPLRHACRCAKTDVVFRWNTKYIFSFAGCVSATVMLFPHQMCNNKER